MLRLMIDVPKSPIHIECVEAITHTFQNLNGLLISKVKSINHFLYLEITIKKQANDMAYANGNVEDTFQRMQRGENVLCGK